MFIIDGSFGEGGGQILRSSLALSMVTGRPFRIERIRAGRSKPGLMRQHLTAVTAAAQIAQAEVGGAAIGSTAVEFRPGQVKPSEYTFAVGTAGSTTLVLQTILPALLTASAPSRLTFEGGTHNPFAPPFDFLARAFLPLVNRMGPTVTATLERPGFYPAGGGRFTVEIMPAAKLEGFELVERGEIVSRHTRVLLADLAGHVAEREVNVIKHKTGWDDSCFTVERITNSHGPGNVVMIEIQTEHVTEVFTGFGEANRAAEAVATHALQQYQRWLKADVPVGPYLADQIMLPLAICGRGRYATMPLSQHSTTHIESFNGKLRDELLNGEIFYTLLEAKVLIERWREHYNRVRPHNALGYRPPAPEAILLPIALGGSAPELPASKTPSGKHREEDLFPGHPRVRRTNITLGIMDGGRSGAPRGDLVSRARRTPESPDHHGGSQPRQDERHRRREPHEDLLRPTLHDAVVLPNCNQDTLL